MEVSKKFGMRKLILKGMLLFIPFFSIIAFVNFNQDPACLFHYELNIKAAEALANNETISIKGYNGGLLHEARIATLNEAPDVLILGSSHALIFPWDEKIDNCYDAAVLGCNLDYYYGILCMFRHENLRPGKIILTAEPWFFTSVSKSPRPQPIQEYIDEGEALVKGEINQDNMKNISTMKLDFSKLKELFSITYFQAGLGADWVKRGKGEIVIWDNQDPGEEEKFKPSMVMVPTTSQLSLSREAMDSEASYQINNGMSYELDQAPELSEEGKAYFEQLVVYLVAAGYDVELYMAPQYPMLYDYIESNPNSKGVLDAEQYVRELGTRLDIPVYGSYNPRVLGIDESDFMDILHVRPNSAWKTYVIVE